MFFSGTFSARRQWLASTLMGIKDLPRLVAYSLRNFQNAGGHCLTTCEIEVVRQPNEKMVFQFCAWNEFNWKHVQIIFVAFHLINWPSAALLMHATQFHYVFARLFRNIFAHKCETPQSRCNEKPSVDILCIRMRVRFQTARKTSCRTFVEYWRDM